MTLEDIKQFRDSIRGKVPFTIICDNQQTFTDGTSDSIVLWFDDKEMFITIRTNPTPTQAGYPFEVVETEYEHIQFLKAHVNAPLLKDMLEASGHPKKDDVYKYLVNTDVARATITNSTGDGINWLGTNANHNTNPPKPVTTEDSIDNLLSRMPDTEKESQEESN